MSDGVDSKASTNLTGPPLKDSNGFLQPPTEPIGVPPPSQPPPPAQASSSGSLLFVQAPEGRRIKRMPELSQAAAVSLGSSVGHIPKIPSTMTKCIPPPVDISRPPPLDLNGEMLMSERLRHAEEANTLLEKAVRALTALSGTLQPPFCSPTAAKNLSDLLRRAAYLASSANNLANKTLRGSNLNQVSPPPSARVQPTLSPKIIRAAPPPSAVTNNPPPPAVPEMIMTDRPRRSSGLVVEEDIAPPPAPPMLKNEPDSLSVTAAVDRAESACSSSKISQLFTKHHYQMCLPIQLSELVSDPVNFNFALNRSTDNKNTQPKPPAQEQPVQHDKYQDADVAPVTASLARDDGMLTKSKDSTVTPTNMSISNPPDSTPLNRLEFIPFSQIVSGPVHSLLTDELFKAKQAERSKRKKYKMTVPPDYKHCVIVEVSEHATVNDAIGETLSLAKKKRRDGIILLDDVNAYVMYTAEDDGKPDRDFPAAEGEQKIADMGCTEFALVENPRYKPAKTLTISLASDSKKTMTVPLCKSHTIRDVLELSCKKFGLKPSEYELQLEDFGVSFDPDSLACDAGTDEFSLQKLSSSQLTSQESQSSEANGNTTANATPATAGAQTPSSSSTTADVSPGPVPLRSVAASGTGHSDSFSFRHPFETLVKSRRASTYIPPRTEDLGPPMLGTIDLSRVRWDVPELANSLKEFRVVYHKSSIHKSQKVMKIDGDWITFMSPSSHSLRTSGSETNSSSASFVGDVVSKKDKKKEAVLPSAISIGDVSAVGLVGGKQNMFYLTIATARFEFESPSKDEIVHKISTILRMRAEAASAADAASAAAAAGTSDETGTAESS